MPLPFYNPWFWVSALAMSAWTMAPLYVPQLAYKTSLDEPIYSINGAVVMVATGAAALWVSIYTFTHIQTHNGYPGRSSWEVTFFIAVWGVMALESIWAVTRIELP